MSREMLDELIDTLDESDKEGFSGPLSSILEYGFIDDTKMAELLELDLTDIDELMDDTTGLKDKQFKRYKKLLISFLKKERNKYERLYYHAR